MRWRFTKIIRRATKFAPIYAAFLVLALFTGCASDESPNVSQPTEVAPSSDTALSKETAWEVGMMAVLRAACRTKESIIALAKADTESEKAAEQVFMLMLQFRQCQSNRQPSLVRVAGIVGAYVDYDGNKVAILRGISPAAPGEDFYFLIIEELAGKIVPGRVLAPPRRSKGKNI